MVPWENIIDPAIFFQQRLVCYRSLMPQLVVSLIGLIDKHRKVRIRANALDPEPVTFDAGDDAGTGTPNSTSSDAKF